MDIDALVNKAAIVRPLLIVPMSGKKKTKVRRAKKETGSSQNHVGKYNVVAELASAPTGMNFGQLRRGDADEASK